VVVVIALLARPMVFGRTFVGWDWYSHQWYIWHQAGALEGALAPIAVRVRSDGDVQPALRVLRRHVLHGRRCADGGARPPGDRDGPDAVIELDQDATPGAAKLTISAAHPWPVVGGWIVTLLGIAGLAANAAMIWRRRRARA
jgi:hypothetical protein